MLEVSWSELKTYQRCPKQWEYKYDQRLVPKRKQRPLFLGSWLHACLESYYKENDWKIGHQIYLAEYNKLFDEEKEGLNKRGVLPDLVERIMKSYLWYYREDGWKVIATEKSFELPVIHNGFEFIIKGILDLIVEDDEEKLWVVDHKSTSNIPDANAYHAMDPQLMLYPWAAERMWDMNIAGIIYNYVKTKAPSEPHINKDGSLSRRKILTDYPTVYRFLKSEGYDPRDFAELLLPLKRRSPFLRRYRLPREQYVTDEILLDAFATTSQIAASQRRSRTITRDCARMCGYHDLCRSELNGFDTEIMRKADFTLKPAGGEEIYIDIDEDGEEE